MSRHNEFIHGLVAASSFLDAMLMNTPRPARPYNPKECCGRLMVQASKHKFKCSCCGKIYNDKKLSYRKSII